ncbi:MAG: signal peptidase I [Candidatus Hodarchaeales archaeon]
MEKSDIIELVILVIIALTLAFGFSIGLNLVLKTDYPNIAVETRSMTPTYWGYKDYDNDPSININLIIINIPLPSHWLRGDLLIVQNVSYSKLQLGDVIVFDVDHVDIPVVHRIVAIKIENDKRSFLTKGDDNPISDSSEISLGNRFGWISQENVHGKVILRVPHIGWISLQLLSPEGKTVLVLIAGALLILSFGDEDEEEEKEESKETLPDSSGITDDSSQTSNGMATPQAEEQDNPNESIVEGNDEEIRNISSKIRYSIKKRLTKKYWQSMVKPSTTVPLAIILIILSVFTFSAVINFISGSCSVQLVSRDGELPVTEWSEISSSTGAMEKWSSDTPGYSIYAYNVKLKITSRGFFNWISSVDVETNTSTNGQGDNLYRWTIVYDFHGTKTINAMVKMKVLDSVDVHHVQVTITFKTAGLLHQHPVQTSHNITLSLA